MDDELIKKMANRTREKLKAEGIEMTEGEARDGIMKAIEKDENEIIERILAALKETIEQPLSDKKHWKTRAVASVENGRCVTFRKFHGWLLNTIFAKGKSTLFLGFATKDKKFPLKKSYILDSKFSVVEPWKAAARWLGVDIPPPLHEVLGPGIDDILS